MGSIYTCRQLSASYAGRTGLNGPVDWTQARRLKSDQLIGNSGADARHTVISSKRLLEMATRTHVSIASHQRLHG